MPSIWAKNEQELGVGEGESGPPGEPGLVRKLVTGTPSSPRLPWRRDQMKKGLLAKGAGLRSFPHPHPAPPAPAGGLRTRPLLAVVEMERKGWGRLHR